jgi:hypothetical protein
MGGGPFLSECSTKMVQRLSVSALGLNMVAQAQILLNQCYYDY